MQKNKNNEVTICSSSAEYLIYVASVADEENGIEIRYEDKNIWLIQKMMPMLYDVETHTINYYIKKIFNDSELQSGNSYLKISNNC